MRIGIDISQIVYEGTGVGTYVRRMVETLLKIDKKNTYILFGASMRRRGVFKEFAGKCAKLVVVPIGPTILSFVWNTLHMLPVETFTGPLDVFWSSDWTQPPLSHAKGVTTIHDLSTMRFPKEMDGRIVRTNAARLRWVKKECEAILCDSEATKKDVIDLLHIPASKLHVVYPAI